MKVLLALGLLVTINLVSAQDQYLDPTFSDYGVLLQDFAGEEDIGYSVLITNDSKILIAGSTKVNVSKDFFILKLNADGTRDLDFGDNGIALYDFYGQDDFLYDMIQYEDGRLLLVGAAVNQNSLDFAALRCFSNGSLDNSFNQNGKFSVSIQPSSKEFFLSAKLLEDGKVLLNGQLRESSDNQDFCTIKMNLDGSLDQNFGVNGVLRVNIGHHDYPSEIDVSDNGFIYQVGTTWYNSDGNYGDITLMRYTPNGILDNSFGVVTIDYGYEHDFGFDIEIHNGSIFLSGISSDGNTEYDYTLLKLNLDGILDTSFGDNGRFKIDCNGNSDFATEFTIIQDGSIIIGGYETDNDSDATNSYFVKCTPNGKLDSIFGDNGKIYFSNNYSHNYSNDIALQGDGKIVSVGSVRNGNNETDLLVLRLIPDQTLNNSEALSLSNLEIYPIPTSFELTIVCDKLIGSDYSLGVFDQTGQKVSTSIYSLQKVNEKQILLNVEKFTVGIFFIRLLTKENTYSKTFIKI